MNLELASSDFYSPNNISLASLTHTLFSTHKHTEYFLFAHKHECTSVGGGLNFFPHFAILKALLVFKALQENYNRIIKSETAPGKATK